MKIKLKKINNPRYQEEGDIHIWEDDHIEWDKIEGVLLDEGMREIKRVDYTLCRERGAITPLYDNFKERYHDVSMLIARK